MHTSDNINDIATALSAAQGELSDVTKDQQGYGYKYADLASIHHIIRPVLVKHGLSFVQETSSDGDHVQVTTRLMHVSGQWVEAGPLAMVAEPKKGLSHAQCVGSTITYARRYALSALLGIASEDDDGSSGRDSTETKGKARAAKKTAQKPAESVSEDVKRWVDELKKCVTFELTFECHNAWTEMTAEQKKASWPLLSEDEHKFIKMVSESEGK